MTTERQTPEPRKSLTDFNGDIRAFDKWKREIYLPSLRIGGSSAVKFIEVQGPERVVTEFVEVEKRVEVPVDNAETKARLERAESDLHRANNLLAKAQQVPPQTEPELQPPSDEDADFVRSFLHDGEAYGDAEARLVEEAAALNNRLMSGMIDGAERDRLKVLTRLFTVTKRIAVDAL